MLVFHHATLVAQQPRCSGCSRSWASTTKCGSSTSAPKAACPKPTARFSRTRKVPAIELERDGDKKIPNEPPSPFIWRTDLAEAGLAPGADRRRSRGVPRPCWSIAMRSSILAYPPAPTGSNMPATIIRSGCSTTLSPIFERVLTERPFAAGDRFTAADTQLASTIGYTMTQLKVLPERPVFKEYMARIEERPAHKRAQQKDQELAMATPFFQAQFAQAQN